jgi:hypothetical protein
MTLALRTIWMTERLSSVTKLVTLILGKRRGSDELIAMELK